MTQDWQYEPLEHLPPEALAANSRLMNAMRNATYRGIRWWLKRQYHFAVEGAEVLHQARQFVLIANHTSHLDAICLLAAMTPMQRNHCYAAAASDYFYTNAVMEFLARLLANTFPFKRRTDPKRSLQACASILERGDSLIFFPEGTRSLTGELQPFKKGVGALVQGKPYPVIPAHLDGAHKVLAKGRLRPRTAAIRLRFGSPEVFAQMPSGDEAATAIAEHLYGRIKGLEPAS